MKTSLSSITQAVTGTGQADAKYRSEEYSTRIQLMMIVCIDALSPVRAP